MPERAAAGEGALGGAGVQVTVVSGLHGCEVASRRKTMASPRGTLEVGGGLWREGTGGQEKSLSPMGAGAEEQGEPLEGVALEKRSETPYGHSCCCD